MPSIPENAPFTAEQRLWLNGYLAGLFSNANTAAPGGLSAAPSPPPKPLTILFGSQTGTAEGLAKKTGAEAAKRGFAPRLVDMAKFASVDLAKEPNVLVITSTYGDGEPPDNAQGFWDYLRAETAPPLGEVSYSVLALGDTNYPAFCEFGKKCDERLAQLGARRVHPRIDCDVDYDAPAKTWTDGVFEAFSGEGLARRREDAKEGEEGGTPAPLGGFAPLREAFSRANPFPARLLANRLLNAPGSAKEVRHFELSLEGSGLSYEVGDALGVLPVNCGAAVDEILAALGCDGEEAVAAPGGKETSLRLALARHYDITRPSSDFLQAAAERCGDGTLRALLDPARREELKKYLWGREIIDLLLALETKFTAAEFTTLLKKLQPRLYSISSSPKAHPGEVHLTVAAVRYEAHGRVRKGVCSTFLADRCREAAEAPVFVQQSHGFRLPSDPARPVIMVGPGTGVAPFRAFLQERRAVGATGQNWLFFGDQCAATDFLYRKDLAAMKADGSLSRLDTAFSRDQAKKIYVQHRMIEAAAELWSWLESGAHFYVCGDASRMAKDVDAALHTVCESAGGLSREAAAACVARLKAEKRYQRDVY